MLLIIFFVLLALVALFFLIARFYLSGPDHSRYQPAQSDYFYDNGSNRSDGHDALVKFVTDHYIAPKDLKLKEKIAYTRNGYEVQGRTRTFKSEFIPATAQANGLDVPGEWTIPPKCDPSKRILFLHGGAFMLGSPLSHRPITDNLARRTGCAVFAADYRLGPENKRMDGIKDSQAAYVWLLENGPDGRGVADKIAVAGDSAGGNLTLMLSNWTRDTAVRRPDAAVGLSPLTDATRSCPSVKANDRTDIVLGPAARPLNKLPLSVFLWLNLLIGKISPAHKWVSPLFDDLHDLPPTLIQVSNTEILYDDARRYAAKAKEAGSPATLQIWRGQGHVWQHYDEIIPEALPALDEIAKFLKAHGVCA